MQLINLGATHLFADKLATGECRFHVLNGSAFPLTDLVEVPINGIFVMVLAVTISLGVYVLMFRSSWGLQVRAISQNRVMADAVGITQAGMSNREATAVMHQNVPAYDSGEWIVYRRNWYWLSTLPPPAEAPRPDGWLRTRHRPVKVDHWLH